MYRCSACDTPSQFNCACYTQMERPEPKPIPLREPEQRRVNIASGEDALVDHENEMYGVEYS